MSKDRKGNTQSSFKILGASSHAEHDRQENDYYSTDPKAVRMLLEMEEFSQNIREPACGEGHLSKEMKLMGKNVYSTDIIDRGYGDGVIDFLNPYSGEIKQEEIRGFVGDIITNPPYKFAEEFIVKALELTENKVAMFLKIQFLEGKGRKELFKKHPPKVIYVSSSRIKCNMNGIESKNSSAVCYAWYVREKGYAGETIIKWFN